MQLSESQAALQARARIVDDVRGELRPDGKYAGIRRGVAERRDEAKAARAAAPEKPPDPQAQARRVEKREGRIESGLAQLEAWLADLVSQGLVAARTQPPQYWAQMAARLVDAQAPGVARRVRD